MINAVELFPGPNRIIPHIAFDEFVFCPHGKRFIGERFFRLKFGDQHIRVTQQEIIGSQYQVIGAGVGVDRSPKIHSKVLNHRECIFLHQRESNRFFGNVEIGLDLQRRQDHGLTLIGKALFRSPIRGQGSGEVFFETQQAFQCVPVLRDRQSPYRSVLFCITGPSSGNRCGDPGVERRFFCGGELWFFMGRHGSVVNLLLNRLPEKQLPIGRIGGQLINTDSGLGHVLVVTTCTIFFE